MRTDAIAIVPSAGLGKRFDPSRKKTFVDLEGTPVFIQTLQRLQQEESITEIIPVLGRDDIEKGSALIKSHGLNKVKQIAPGGDERQDSIFNALKLLAERAPLLHEDIPVLIHDGVRPFIPEGQITDLLKGLETYDGIAPGIPVKDTLKEINSESIITATVDREKVRAIQTPQVFLYTTIRRAYDVADEKGYYATDDAALVEMTGGTVKIIDGSPYNIKITTPEDLEMLKYFFSKEHAV